ncbi:type V CRISPR-associated protein Cas12k [Scytonema sp. PRP1]
MSVITIQCRLVAEENTLRQLWELMAEKNTPLINELLEQVGQHPDFEKWLKKGEVPEEAIETIKKSLITQEPFAGQPGRFYTSAVTLVKEIYKSWFALQQERQRKIEGKERWLKMLKSDIELQQESQCNLDIIRNKANEILTSFVANFTENRNQQLKKKAIRLKKIKKKRKSLHFSTHYLRFTIKLKTVCLNVLLHIYSKIIVRLVRLMKTQSNMLNVGVRKK